MKTISRDDKLEQIMRLREYQQNNMTHVNTMAGIISPEATYAQDETQDKNQTGVPSFYGKLRLVLCLFILGAVYLYHYTIERPEDTFTKTLQSEIRRDYSDNVVAFVKEFTYTLDYEKTSTE